MVHLCDWLRYSPLKTDTGLHVPQVQCIAEYKKQIIKQCVQYNPIIV